MKMYKTLFILSAILILLPVIGVYSSWKQAFVFAVGVYTAWVALSLWRKAKQESLNTYHSHGE